MNDVSDLTLVGSSNEVDASLQRVLDVTAERFNAGRGIYAAMGDLVDGLQAALEREVVRVEHLRRLVDRHSVAALVRQCAFTSHALRKPRGYAGDAELIDYIYQHRDNSAFIAESSTLGQLVLAHNLDSVAATAVRNRRRILASAITETVHARDKARILSVACGHAREIELLPRQILEAIGCFVAFDQDEQSLDRVSQLTEAGLRVDPIAGHFAQIFRRRDLVSFDLIYAAGLFDYLDQAACRKLTNHLFGRLQRDGRLIVANFLSGQRCRGYMELMMDWHLVHRDRSEIEDFAAMIDPTKIAEANYFVEPTGTIGFLELTRR